MVQHDQRSVTSVSKHRVCCQDGSWGRKQRQEHHGVLAEEEDEVLRDKVNEVMEAIGEKPRIEDSSLRKVTVDNPRPVKMTLSSTLIVDKILPKARQLKDNAKYKSLEKRAEHRTLVFHKSVRTGQETFHSEWVSRRRHSGIIIIFSMDSLLIKADNVMMKCRSYREAHRPFVNRTNICPRNMDC